MTTTENDATLMIRLPTRLKAELMRQAAMNGRRITTEINMRLQDSIEQAAPARSKSTAAREANDTNDSLSDVDRSMLELFRRMPYEKQLAMLSLLR